MAVRSTTLVPLTRPSLGPFGPEAECVNWTSFMPFSVMGLVLPSRAIKLYSSGRMIGPVRKPDKGKPAKGCWNLTV